MVNRPLTVDKPKAFVNLPVPSGVRASNPLGQNNITLEGDSKYPCKLAQDWGYNPANPLRIQAPKDGSKEAVIFVRYVVSIDCQGEGCPAEPFPVPFDTPPPPLNKPCPDFTDFIFVEIEVPFWNFEDMKGGGGTEDFKEWTKNWEDLQEHISEALQGMEDGIPKDEIDESIRKSYDRAEDIVNGRLYKHNLGPYQKRNKAGVPNDDDWRVEIFLNNYNRAIKNKDIAGPLFDYTKDKDKLTEKYRGKCYC